MRSYLMMREIQPKYVFVSVDRMGLHIPEPQRPDQSPNLPYELMRCDYVPLYSWGTRRVRPYLPGTMGYHNKTGTIIHTEDFPVWEWLLLEILANLAEQWRATRYSLGENLVGHRYLRTIWWLSEGVPMDALMTPDEQVEWDGKRALLWVNSGCRKPAQYPDYTKHVDVWWDFDRCFVEAE